MPVPIGIAEILVKKLNSVPKCPQGDMALDAVAEALAGMCGTEADAEWLINEACYHWRDWKGIPELRAMLHNRNNPELPPSNLAKDLGPKPTGMCPTCDDWGHYTDEADPLKLRKWCTCEMGVWQEQRHPGMMEALNRSKLKDTVADIMGRRRQMRGISNPNPDKL